MFDIGFWELCLIAVVSLVVIGPEKLPKAARITGFWIGKMRQTVASVKEEIKEELESEEIRQTLNAQSKELEELKQISAQANQIFDDVKSSVNTETASKQTPLDPPSNGSK